MEVDEAGAVLDGHHRVAIAEELGIDYPRVTRTFASDGERREHAILLNLCRRHLEPHQWGGLFKQLLDARGVERGQGSSAAKQHSESDTVSDSAQSLGVDERTARRRMAAHDVYESLPASEREAIDAGEKTVTQVMRERKEANRERRRGANREQIASAPARVPETARFATIVIDPPWDWGDENDCDQLGRARPTYATMPLGEIETFEPVPGRGIADLADVDCHLYLWITNRSLPKGFGLLDAWGFRYVTCLTWCKPSIGMGNYFRGSSEQVLFGIKGSQPLRRHDVGTWFQAKRPGKHSAKPDEFFALVESCSPGPYLEVFARSERDGWICLGGEL